MEQYVQNPKGKNSMVFNASAREHIRNSYISKYDAILLRERGKIDYYLYEDKKTNRFFAHFKIPSEVVPKFYYDVVLEFSADENVKNTEDLFKYNVRFFSNDPAFVYTYANAFEVNKLFVEELRPRMSKKALHKEAKERNPRGEIGYVKSVFFAYITMRDKGLNKKNKFSAEAMKFSKMHLLETVRNADDVIAERQQEGEKVARQKSATRSKEKKEKKTEGLVQNTLGIKTTKSIGSIKSTKSNNKIIGSVKKLKRK